MRGGWSFFGSDSSSNGNTTGANTSGEIPWYQRLFSSQRAPPAPAPAPVQDAEKQQTQAAAQPPAQPPASQLGGRRRRRSRRRA